MSHDFTLTLLGKINDSDKKIHLRWNEMIRRNQLLLHEKIELIPLFRLSFSFPSFQATHKEIHKHIQSESIICFMRVIWLWLYKRSAWNEQDKKRNRKLNVIKIRRQTLLYIIHYIRTSNNRPCWTPEIYTCTLLTFINKNQFFFRNKVHLNKEKTRNLNEMRALL